MLVLGRRLAEQLAKAQGDADAFASERDALQKEVEVLISFHQNAFSVPSIIDPPFTETQFCFKILTSRCVWIYRGRPS